MISRAICDMPPGDAHPADGPTVSGLVSGIVSDAQELMRQQLALFKHEVKQDLNKTKQAAIALGIGIGIALVGGLSLWLMLVYLLYWAFPVLTLWGCYGIIGFFFLVAGALVFLAGMEKMRSFNPLPDETVGAFKENIRWIMRPK